MTLLRGIEIPLQIHAIGSNPPLLILSLINSGAMGKFIDIDYVWVNNLCTQWLPRAIPVYNVDGTLNKAGYITEVVDLIIQYKSHLPHDQYQMDNYHPQPHVAYGTQPQY